jgi:hypothetical protein
MEGVNMLDMVMMGPGEVLVLMAFTAAVVFLVTRKGGF